MGITGEATYQFLLAAGVDKQQLLTFDEKSPAQYSKYKQLESLPIGTLVVSPGVPLAKPEVQSLIARAQLLTSEMSLVSSVLDTEICIGLTGSLGKSTTTSALGAALSSIDSNCFVGGNLGLAFANYGKNKLLKTTPTAKFIILELSSYHLENSDDLRLNTSAITYLSPNHLERYTSLTHYYETKLKILEKTQEDVILNSFGGDLKKISFPEGMHTENILWSYTDLTPYQVSNLIGQHNQENLSVVHRILDSLKTHGHLTEAEVKTALRAALQFGGLPHRLENCGSHQGVTFINDSKATALDSVVTAVQASKEQLKSSQSTLHLLVGGKDKNLPWSEIKNMLDQDQLKITLFGESRNLIGKQLGLPESPYVKLESAFKSICPQLKAGDVVLLSPGGTSLDEFKNFEDRGDHFKNYIRSFLTKKYE